MPILYGKHKRCGGTTGARLHWLAQDGHNQRNSHFLLNGYYRGVRLRPGFHARHCRVPNKVPNGPSSRILLAARSSSTSLRARLFDSAIRFGVSAGGAARLWCSTTIFFAKIYQFRVGFGKPYREAPFPHMGGGVLLALFACSTPCSAHLLGGLLDSAARKTYLYRPIRFDCTDR